MKLKFYPIVRTVLTTLFAFISIVAMSQDCASLNATYSVSESRCIATGVITINATGGSGNYNYKVEGPVTLAYTSSNTITGLSAGTYTISVKDVISGCIVQTTNVQVNGSYNDPRFSLVKTDLTCINSSDGTISIADLQYGRSPFTYTVMAPSPSSAGISNSTGTFGNLTAGEYVIQMRDSCGGIQTRRITVLNYDWWIDGHSVSAIDCDNVRVTINLKDNKGNMNTSGSVFSGFRYAIVRSAGDTVWTTSRITDVNIGKHHTLEIYAKDGCGNLKKINWTNPRIPSLAAAASTAPLSCSTFTASVSGKSHLAAAQYSLYTNSNTLISTNATGNFTVSAGSYCIRANDPCYDTVISRCFTVKQSPPAVAANVTVSKSCSTFNATVTGQSNLNNALYEIFNSSGISKGTSTNGSFTNLAYGVYTIRIKDGCYDTTIVKTVTAAPDLPAVNASVSLSNNPCSTFNASYTHSNLTNPVFTLYNSTGTVVATNNTGSFVNLLYGSYTMTMVNGGCFDTTISRTFSRVRPVPNVNANPSYSSATCAGVTAAIGGSNLTNAQYCLFDRNNNLVECNGNGIFTNLSYQQYSVRVVNGPCYDTTFLRSFTPVKPIAAYTGFTYSTTCSTFTATVSTSNLLSPVYTIYDNATMAVMATTTNGIFTLPYGDYCIIARSNVCSDTLPKVCYPVSRPAAVPGVVTISNQQCSTVTASVTGGNLTNATYSLYNTNNVFVASNTTGIFTNVPYGPNSIRILDDCYNVNTVIPFTSSKPVPSIGSDVNLTNKACSTFTASLSGQVNMPSATYRLYNSNNQLVSTNSNGQFTNLLYGSYCIQATSSCYDTTITRCFTQLPVPVDLSVTASATCTIGATNLKVVYASGTAPFTTRVYAPGGVLVRTVSGSATTVNIADIPGLPSGLQYTVIGSDNCNVKDTMMVTPVAGTLNRNRSFTTRCPSGEWQNGATSFDLTASSNLGSVIPVIIKKNGTNVSIPYSTLVAGVYKFIDLEPASYIVAYNIQNCSNPVYDTINVSGYSYPNLQQSAAYQCDNNSFSVGASLQGGASPYTYEVIGSYPASPAIIRPAQADPVFNISNGTEYSLVRLRSIDACGNATLSDVSILPLANIVVSATSNCFTNNINLSVDSIPNASYTWYRKITATDSVIVGSSITYNIPYLMPSDTGVYVCKTSVNNGCLTKIAAFHVTGLCGSILTSKVVLSGKAEGESNQLNWTSVNDADAKEYIVERSESKNGEFVPVGKIIGGRSSLNNYYTFKDINPAGEYSYYRLKIVYTQAKFDYSNMIMIRQSSGVTVSLFPNPVKNVLSVYLSSKQKQNYRLSLFSTTGQKISEKTYEDIRESTIQIQRDRKITPGVYILRITNAGNGQTNAYRVVFE